MVLDRWGRLMLSLGQAAALLLLLELPLLAQSSEIEEIKPVSAEEQPLVVPKDSEALLDEAGVEETEAEAEIVVVPLSDRCLALENEPETELEAEPAATQPAEAQDLENPDLPESDPATQASEQAAVATEASVTEAPATTSSAPPDDISAETNRNKSLDPAQASEPESEPETDPETDPEIEAEAAARIAAEKQTKREICKLYQADQLYQSGQHSAAEAIYQTIKPPFSGTAATEPLVPVLDPEDLPPAGRVYLREATAGQAQNLETRTLVPLKLLTENHPEFVPGHAQYAEALTAAGQGEQALAVLNRAVALHPNDADLIRTAIEVASAQNQWMDASMQARRFAQLNPDHPDAEAFDALAQENLKRFQGEVRDRLTANTIANVLTGAVTYGVTGNIWNTLSTIQTTTLMLRGEAGVGNGISKSIQRQIPLVEDEEVVTYVNDLGQKLAKVAGRDEFEYEFFVIMDENLNAFALPGGKVFVNAGAIAKTRSEAELAGLLAHELAHAVLSHGFQLVSNGSLLSDLSRFVPYAGYAANLVVLDYSRTMEREADELGTRILSAAGYPADGLHNLMLTLGKEDKSRPLFAWMSTHPETDERVQNIQRQIEAEGFDRYGFEGIERHDRMRERVKVLIEIAKQEAEEEAQNRPWWR